MAASSNNSFLDFLSTNRGAVKCRACTKFSGFGEKTYPRLNFDGRSFDCSFCGCLLISWETIYDCFMFGQPLPLHIIFKSNSTNQDTDSEGFNMAAKQTSIIWDMTNNCYTLELAFPPRPHQFKDVTEAIKRIVPAACRNYDPNTKHWQMTEEYLRPVKGILEAVYGRIFVFEKPDAPPPPPGGFTGGLSTDGCVSNFAALVGLTVAELNGMDIKQATKIYRKAALLLHPDRNNGDGSKMSELNEAWAFLKENYFKETVGA